MYKQIEMNWACHTRHRFCLAVVVSMLFCGLSSSEIPELTRLIDDTSNDFTVLVAARGVRFRCYERKSHFHRERGSAE